METLVKSFSGLRIINKLLKPRIDVVTVPNRGRKQLNHPPKKRYSPWLLKQTRALVNENLTGENTKFIQDVIETKYGKPDPQSGAYSPLKIAPIEPVNTWTQKSRRTGLIARKLGIYPMWMKNGKKVLTTLLQVCDNHVIKYIPPEEWQPMINKSKLGVGLRKKYGCMIVGADSVDPQMFTKQYCGLFTDAGVMPKRMLARFLVTPDAALQPGTPLTAAHYKPGDYIDIRGKTMDRGFQGVMKRWGFKGMPATHGVTKTHRRPGNIGSGGGKARVMPGTKMPGHMGNRYRIFPCVQILRINTKYNVIWIRGQALPGETNNFLQIYDALLPHKRYTRENPPHFPTYIPKEDEPLPEEMMIDELHRFDAPTIEFQVEDKK